MNSLIKSLSNSERLVFSACCCERIITLYAEFAKKYEFGDEPLLRKMLNDVWYAILTGETRSLEIHLQTLPNLVPHGDDFPGVESMYALNVCICIDCLLRDCLAEKETGHLVSQYTLDCVRGAILEQHDEIDVLDDAAEKVVLESKLFQKEIEYQIEDAKDAVHATAEGTALLRERAVNNTYHFITDKG